MILHGYWRSTAAYRVRIALNLKGLEVADSPVDLQTGAQRDPDYLALNPQGLVPCLVDGPTALSQSLAIIEYLEETHALPPLLPADPVARAKVRAASLAIACEIHPINNLRVLNYLRGELGQPQDALDGWIRHWIAEGFAALEAGAGQGPYLFGAAVTMADLCLVPQIYSARRFGTELTRYPRLTEIERNLLALPAFDRARPENQPDATR
ncbi:MAG: maiA [Rhodospirillales bacterium]|nr:maiA [Rhodospirillales bacterium]